MEIKWFGHSSFEIKSGNKVIYLDPYLGEYEDAADIVLVSHGHFDHSNIKKLSPHISPDTKIIGSKNVAAEIGGKGLEEGQSFDADGINIEAVASYNPNKQFHPRGFGVGWVISTEGKKVYFAGDTDFIPEMSELKDIDVALLPIGGTYTMSANDAVEAAKAIKPKIIIPMHYNTAGIEIEADPFKFKEKVENLTGAKVVVLRPNESHQI